MTDDVSLPTALWLTAELRRLQNNGDAIYIVRKGDMERGQVLVRLNLMGTDKALIQTVGRDGSGQKIWLKTHHEATINAEMAEQSVRKAIAADPDLWVIEIDVKTGHNPITLI